MINNKPDAGEPNGAEGNLAGASTGGRIRRLRQTHGLSQRKLAALAGLTNGAISMMEQDRVSPSVASLKKVLGVLGTSLTEFFADDFEPDTRIFFRGSELSRISDGLVVIRQAGGNMSRRMLQMLHETYAPGGDTGPAMLSHEGEEAGIIIRGNIEVTVGSQTEVLGPGDSYYFNSQTPHRFRNIGTDECEVVSSCSPPSF